jgi:hypothetical protein
VAASSRLIASAALNVALTPRRNRPMSSICSAVSEIGATLPDGELLNAGVV